MLGSKISNALDNDKFAAYFIPLELKEERKEDYVTRWLAR